LCRSAELFAFEGAHLWNIPFDDKLAQCHIFSPSFEHSPENNYTPPPSLDHLVGVGT
jgi:hypothetical protein